MRSLQVTASDISDTSIRHLSLQKGSLSPLFGGAGMRPSFLLSDQAVFFGTLLYKSDL